MLLTDHQISVALVRSFSHGDTRNSGGGGKTVIPRACPIAASIPLSQRRKVPRGAPAGLSTGQL